MPKPVTGAGRGGKALPTERKRMTGNPGRRKLPAAPTPTSALEVIDVDRLPPAPEHLGPVGRLAWEYVWRGGRRHLSESQDSLLIARVAEKVELVARLNDWLGDDVERRWYTTANGQVVTHPAVKQLEQADAQLTAWLSMLGFTPSDRARLGLQEIRVADALDAYRRRSVVAEVVDASA